MIPLHLSITGFLSYRDPAEIDFTGIDLACIAGANGAGKSSLLDAITWALFGQARKRDDALINAQSTAADVSLTFAYEGNLYRVQRIKVREKPTLLEFHIYQSNGDQPAINSALYSPDQLRSGKWKPLTEHTLRETEDRIQQMLRLDYDTFVNASFFLQGKADQFTQQRPSDRKRILSSILDLEVWELYQQKAAEHRRSVESDMESIDGRLQEIAAELAEEDTRKSHLKELEADLKRLSKERKIQEDSLASIRQIAATLAEQQRLVDTLARQWDHAALRLQELQARLDSRSQERDTFADILGRAAEIEAAYQAWQQKRLELERLDVVASQFREHEKRREAPRLEIQSARARLEQEALTLENQRQELDRTAPEIANLRQQYETTQAEINAFEQQLRQRDALDADLQSVRQSQADLRAENARLKADMDELKTRIDRLSQAEGPDGVIIQVCPLCGQPLSPQDRQKLIETLVEQGKEMGARYRSNQTRLRDLDAQSRQVEGQIALLSQVDAQIRLRTQTLAQLASRLEMFEAQGKAWEETGAVRLAEIQAALQDETYASEARLQLAQIDAELKAIGYDALAHDAARQAEAQARSSETSLRDLEKARSALAPLEREITDLHSQISAQQAEVDRQGAEHLAAAQALGAAHAQAPDLYAAEQAAFDLQERENRLRLEVGAAQQKVLVLGDLKTRRKTLESQREDLANQVRQYKQLERAFSKDGVPALLIEQALPEIESKANELLDRLSGGNMSVRFVTQAAYKDKKREDLKETLDIQISDNAGTRDYEMFSGGEAFRVNFAIRLALADVLAKRAGARLQTLVIDEGFGSQDTQGRQRLIEAINSVRQNYAKILVITHIDELKDAFPNRIEVEKTDRGSVVKVI